MFNFYNITSTYVTFQMCIWCR